MTQKPGDYYQILQISPKADPAIVKAAYYTILKTLRKHPDLGGSHEEAASLNEAYEVLSDPVKRQNYDRRHFKGFASHASAPEKNPFVPDHESRRALRAVFQNRLRFKTRWGDWAAGQFCDISLMGACFRTKEPVKEGKTIEMDISDSPLVQPTAKVRWVRMIPQRFGSPLYECGILFKTIDTGNFRKFLNLVGLSHLLRQ